jgi:hypothetical protein
MQLNAEQLKAFDEQGYVFFPSCFSEDEIALLRVEADKILKLDRPEVWRENPARHAPPLPRTSSTRCSRSWRAIRAWSNR